MIISNTSDYKGLLQILKGAGVKHRIYDRTDWTGEPFAYTVSTKVASFYFDYKGSLTKMVKTGTRVA